MLTELKKTMHIVIDEPFLLHHAPDEYMIVKAVQDHVSNGEHPRVFEEHGDALQAAGHMVKDHMAKDQAASYYDWTVDMHFIRTCAFEPRTQPLRSIVAVVHDKCKELAEAIVDDLQLVVARDKAPEVTKQVTEKLHELFEDGAFCMPD